MITDKCTLLCLALVENTKLACVNFFASLQQKMLAQKFAKKQKLFVFQISQYDKMQLDNTNIFSNKHGTLAVT